jgi:hypothetical protein
VTAFELADPEGQLMEEIADRHMGRRQVALTYGLALRGDVNRVDWPKVNRAIVDRWSMAGLKWIKDFAWKAPVPATHRKAGERDDR